MDALFSFMHPEVVDSNDSNAQYYSVCGPHMMGRVADCTERQTCRDFMTSPEYLQGSQQWLDTILKGDDHGVQKAHQQV